MKKTIFAVIASLLIAVTPVFAVGPPGSGSGSGSTGNVDNTSANQTWGNAGTITWTFNASGGTDCQLVMTDGVMTLPNCPLKLGTGSSVLGTLVLFNNTNNNPFTIFPGATGVGVGWRLPAAAPGGANYLLNVDADGTMDYTDPATFQAAGAKLAAIQALASASGYLRNDGAGTFSYDNPAGTGDVVGPASHAASLIPQWNSTPDSKTLVAGLTLDTDLSSVSASDDSVPSAKATKAALDLKVSASSAAAYTEPGSNLPLCRTGAGTIGGCSNVTDVAFSSYVAKATYDAQSILAATTDDTPAAVTVNEQNLVGRVTGGNVGTVAIDSDLASVSANHDSVPSAKAVKNKIQYKSWSFDPKAVCDGAVDRLFLMSAHGGQGIIITQWKISFEADPTTEVDLDLKRADAWIGVANAAVMDTLDTTNGAASESTASNINGGNAVAEGKVIYLEFGTAYTEANHQIIFEMWFYEVGN